MVLFRSIDRSELPSAQYFFISGQFLPAIYQTRFDLPASVESIRFNFLILIKILDNMKKAFATLGLRSFVAVFFVLGGLFLTPNRAGAQSYNWKTGPEALSELNNQVDQFSIQLSGQTPGTPAYNNSLAHLHYYKEISSEIEGGAAVDQAALNSLSIFDVTVSSFKANAETTDVTVTKTMVQTLYADAVVILTN